MNNIQLKMFKNIIDNNNEGHIGEHYFKISPRINILCEADYIINGNKTVLGIGSHSECVEYIIDCVKMIYDI